MQEYELRRNNFSDDGNFGFRIQEHIDLGPNVMQAAWAGWARFCIAGRMRRARPTGTKRRLSKEEAVCWFQQVRDGIILSGK